MANLPDEILEIIFLNLAISGTAHYIEADDPEVVEERARLTTLYNILLVSKRFHRIAFPILYRTLDFDLIDDDNNTLLLETLCRHPRVCDHVQSIKIAATGMQTRSWWGRDVAGMLKKRPALRNVQLLEIREWSVYGDDILPDFPLICNLPALMTLRLCGFVSTPGAFPRMERPSMARTIEFVDSEIDAETVEVLLPSFPALTTLSIDMRFDPGIEDPFSYIHLGDALCQHGTKLTSFTLDFNDTELKYPESLSLRTLAPLLSLVNLTMPLDALIDCGEPDTEHGDDDEKQENKAQLPLARKLPTCLQTLTLLGLVYWVDWEEVDTQLAALMRDPSFVNLSRIELLRRHVEDTGREEQYSFSAPRIADTPWRVRNEIRHVEPRVYAYAADQHWEIFERAGWQEGASQVEVDVISAR